MIDKLLYSFNKKYKFLTKEKLYSFYEIVNHEIKEGKHDTGIWTKAFVDANGDTQKQKAIYIKLMVEKMVEAEAILLEEAKTVKLEEKNKKKKEEVLKKKREEELEKIKKEELYNQSRFPLKLFYWFLIGDRVHIITLICFPILGASYFFQ